MGLDLSLEINKNGKRITAGHWRAYWDLFNKFLSVTKYQGDDICFAVSKEQIQEVIVWLNNCEFNKGMSDGYQIESEYIPNFVPLEKLVDEDTDDATIFEIKKRKTIEILEFAVNESADFYEICGFY